MNHRRVILPSLVLLAAVVNAVSIGTVIAQVVPQCMLPNAGCVAVPCPPGAGGGNCNPLVPGSPNFTASSQTPNAWTPCGPGAVKNCPNPLNNDVYCIEDGYTGTIQVPCNNWICGVFLTTPGC